MTKFTTYFFFFKSYLTYFAYLDIFHGLIIPLPPPPTTPTGTACAVNSLQSNLHMRKTLVVVSHLINQSINNRVFFVFSYAFYVTLSLVFLIFINKNAF